MKKNLNSAQKYLEALVCDDKALIEEIYRRFSGKFIAFVKKNGGFEGDAALTFGNVLSCLYRLKKFQDLDITCSFGSLLLLLCKRSWLLQSVRSGISVQSEAEKLLRTENEEVVRLCRYIEGVMDEINGMEKAAEKLGEKCRLLIGDTMGGIPQEVIADKMKISVSYLRSRKSVCISRLIKTEEENRMS